MSSGKVFGCERIHHSKTYKDSPKKPAAMPFALFFSKDGCALHAGDPNVESHGCVHLTASDAEWLFKRVGSRGAILPTPVTSAATAHEQRRRTTWTHAMLIVVGPS